MRERGNMIVGDIMRRLFERIENKFKAGIVAARDGDAAEIFQKGSEQSGGFRCGFLLQCLERAAAPIPWTPIRPEPFPYPPNIFPPPPAPPPHPPPHPLSAPRLTLTTS